MGEEKDRFERWWTKERRGGPIAINDLYDAGDLMDYAKLRAQEAWEAQAIRVAEARQRAERAENLLQTVVDKATPYGEINEPGGPYIRSYLLPTGPIHRALAYLRSQSSALTADPPAEAGGEEGSGRG